VKCPLEVEARSMRIPKAIMGLVFSCNFNLFNGQDSPIANQSYLKSNIYPTWSLVLSLIAFSGCETVGRPCKDPVNLHSRTYTCPLKSMTEPMSSKEDFSE
jgi:hypothetical protein